MGTVASILRQQAGLEPQVDPTVNTDEWQSRQLFDTARIFYGYPKEFLQIPDKEPEDPDVVNASSRAFGSDPTSLLTNMSMADNALSKARAVVLATILTAHGRQQLIKVDLPNATELVNAVNQIIDSCRTASGDPQATVVWPVWCWTTRAFWRAYMSLDTYELRMQLLEPLFPALLPQFRVLASALTPAPWNRPLTSVWPRVRAKVETPPTDFELTVQYNAFSVPYDEDARYIAAKLTNANRFTNVRLVRLWPYMFYELDLQPIEAYIHKRPPRSGRINTLAWDWPLHRKYGHQVGLWTGLSKMDSKGDSIDQSVIDALFSMLAPRCPQPEKSCKDARTGMPETEQTKAARYEFMWTFASCHEQDKGNDDACEKRQRLQPWLWSLAKIMQPHSLPAEPKVEKLFEILPDPTLSYDLTVIGDSIPALALPIGTNQVGVSVTDVSRALLWTSFRRGLLKADDFIFDLANVLARAGQDAQTMDLNRLRSDGKALFGSEDRAKVWWYIAVATVFREQKEEGMSFVDQKIGDLTLASTTLYDFMCFLNAADRSGLLHITVNTRRWIRKLQANTTLETALTGATRPPNTTTIADIPRCWTQRIPSISDRIQFVAYMDPLFVPTSDTGLFTAIENSKNEIGALNKEFEQMKLKKEEKTLYRRLWNARGKLNATEQQLAQVQAQNTRISSEIVRLIREFERDAPGLMDSMERSNTVQNLQTVVQRLRSSVR